MAFIDDMRSQGHAVESTCRVLTKHGCTVAARTYRSWRQADRPVAARTASDAAIIDALLATRGTPEGLYGRRKMTAHLRRSGLQVAHCTVDRLMRDLGMNGVRRGKKLRTTISGIDGNRAGDLLDRDFTAQAPNTRWVADFTYCRTWAGFVYVAFVVDVFAQRIVGWHAATDKRTDLVLIPVRIAMWDRDRHGNPRGHRTLDRQRRRCLRQRPDRSSACSRPRRSPPTSSIPAPTGPSPTSSTPPPAGSTGGTTDACTARWDRSHPLSTSRTTTLPSTESRNPYRSGREPVTLQSWVGNRPRAVRHPVASDGGRPSPLRNPCAHRTT
jgi:hypothetical protein